MCQGNRGDNKTAYRFMINLSLRYQIAHHYESLLKRLPEGAYKIVPLWLRQLLSDMQWSFYRTKNKNMNRCLCRLDSPVLLISVPKTGTHLLLSFLMNIPGARLHRDLCTIVSISDADRRRETCQKILKRAKPGCVYYAHVPYDAELGKWLAERGIKKLFLYRDPRDVVVSLYYHVMNIVGPSHAWCSILRRMKSEEERVMCCIRGFGDEEKPVSLVSPWIPNIHTLYSQFLGWIKDEGTLNLRFEDLIATAGIQDSNSNAQHVLNEVLVFLGAVKGPVTDRALDELLREGRDSRKSATFRKGRVGSWRMNFTREHIEAFQEVAGDLLIELGYGWNTEWQNQGVSICPSR